jgi:hypothetical protein
MPLTLADITNYVENNIGTFHQKRLASLRELKLEKLLKRKNPYLFKAKDLVLPQDLVRVLLDAHLSSQEETIFGDFLEGLAIFVNEQSFGGRKSSTNGIDLEFDRKKIRFLVSIKSGPNWGNSGQIEKNAAELQNGCQNRPSKKPNFTGRRNKWMLLWPRTKTR